MVLVARCFLGSYLEIRRADRVYDQGNFREAAYHYSRAIRWHFPGNFLVPKALNRLNALANECQDSDKGIVSSLRFGALASINSIYQPYDVGFQSNSIEQVFSVFVFWVWIVSVFAFIWRGFSPQGQFIRCRRSYILALSVVFSFVLWTLGLYLAE